MRHLSLSHVPRPSTGTDPDLWPPCKRYAGHRPPVSSTAHVLRVFSLCRTNVFLFLILKQKSRQLGLCLCVVGSSVHQGLGLATSCQAFLLTQFPPHRERLDHPTDEKVTE